MTVWFETFSASVPSAIGTPAAASALHLPVCVVPLASFSAEVGFCEMRAPEAQTSSLAGEDGVDGDRFGSVSCRHRPLPRVCAGVPTAAAGVAARWRQTRYPP